MRTSKLLLLIFVWGLCAPVAFAQKQLKYVPRALEQTRKVPYVVNPKLPPSMQVQFVQPVVHLNTVHPVERAVSAQVTAQTASRVALPNGLQKDFLTGPQALAAYMPGWKSELRGQIFTEEQLKVIEQTFQKTDQFLFKLDEEGNWLAPTDGSTEWEYETWFAIILNESPVKFGDGQLKTLFGKFARFDDVFTRLNYQAFLLVHKRAPNANAPGEEGKLARHTKYNLDKRDGRKMNPEVEGYIYGNMPAKLKPPKPSYGRKGYAPRRTPDEILAQVKVFIQANGRFPLRTAEDETEFSLRRAFDKATRKADAQMLSDDTSRELLTLKEQWVNKHTDRRTPQEILTQTKAFIQANGRFPSQLAEDETERSLRFAFRRATEKADTQMLTDDTSRELLALKEQWVEKQADKKTPQQVLAQVKVFIQANGCLPSQHAADETERSLRFAFDKATGKADTQMLTDDTSLELLALKEQWVKKITDQRTPQEVLAQVKAFIQKNGRFPAHYTADETERSLRKAFGGATDKADAQMLMDDTSRELLALKEQWVKKIADQRTPQKVLAQIKAFIKENKRFPSTRSPDETERSLRVAFKRACRKAEMQLLNDDTSRELLTLKEQWIEKQADKRTPQEVLDQVKAFIQANGRFPLYDVADETERSLRLAFNRACKKVGAQMLLDDTSRELLALKEQWVKTSKGL